jgi:hypothetical protein
MRFSVENGVGGIDRTGTDVKLSCRIIQAILRLARADALSPPDPSDLRDLVIPGPRESRSMELVEKMPKE